MKTRTRRMMAIFSVSLAVLGLEKAPESEKTLESQEPPSSIVPLPEALLARATLRAFSSGYLPPPQFPKKMRFRWNTYR